MNLRDLEYIVKVAETGNFIAAAKECNVSQPSMSIQIKKLEGYLGVQIFEREKKKFIITGAGKEILAKAREILNAEKQIKELAKLHKDPLSGQVRLGAFPTIAPYFLPRIMPNLSRKYPKIKFLLVEEKTDILLEMLENGALDAAFIALPVEQKNLQAIGIFSENFVLAVPENHPLITRKDFIHRNDLKNETLLLLEEGHCMRSQTLEYCEMMGKYQLHDFRATSLETLREMVAQGLGVTLMPEMAAHPREGVKYMKFGNPVPARRIGLVFRSSSPRKQVFEEMAPVIRRN